jgi:hypothetical protein
MVLLSAAFTQTGIPAVVAASNAPTVNCRRLTFAGVADIRMFLIVLPPVFRFLGCRSATLTYTHYTI